MKNAFILLLLALAGHTTFGQQYLDILEEDKSYVQWTTECDISGGEKIRISGDTIIGGIQYKQLNHLSCHTDDVLARGFVRTDASNSKIWYTESGAAEQLILDMDLNVGDLFYVELYNSNIIVTSIEYENNRKVITFDTPIGGCLIGPEQGKLQFIEGIGPTYGFNFSGSRMLDCVMMADSLIFKNEDIPWANCNVACLDVLSSSVDLNQEESKYFDIATYPDELVIDLKSHKQFSYIISGIDGRQVSQGKLHLGRNGISLNSLGRGVYFISVFSSEAGINEAHKFIKTK